MEAGEGLQEEVRGLVGPLCHSGWATSKQSEVTSPASSGALLSTLFLWRGERPSFCISCLQGEAWASKGLPSVCVCGGWGGN